MLSVQFALLIILFRNALGDIQLCEPTDHVCITNAIKEHVYSQFVAGFPGVQSSDPLQVELIVAGLPKLKYSLKNSVLTGLKHCDFLAYKLIPEESAFNYELLCPKLVIQSEYEVKGELDTMPIEGQDNCKIIYDNYHIDIGGKYEKIKQEDDKIHFHILEYSFVLDLQSGSATEYHNLVISDQGKADEYSKKLEESTREIIMKSFLTKFIENLKDFHKAIPLQDLHFRNL